LKAGTNYFYAIEVWNFNGPSDKSDLASRKACEVPQNFNSLKVTLTSASKITLEWRQPADDGECVIENYQVMVDNGN